MTQIRQHRVDAFAAWLRTAPGSPPFFQHPGFRFFRDLTQAEIAAAGEIMRAEGNALNDEADELDGAA